MKLDEISFLLGQKAAGGGGGGGEIGGKEYRRTASDLYYIEREGRKYIEAVDPIDILREYTETDIPLPEPEEEEEQEGDE